MRKQKMSRNNVAIETQSLPIIERFILNAPLGAVQKFKEYILTADTITDEKRNEILYLISEKV